MMAVGARVDVGFLGVTLLSSDGSEQANGRAIDEKRRAKRQRVATHQPSFLDRGRPAYLGRRRIHRVRALYKIIQIRSSG